mgnify:FL=1
MATNLYDIGDLVYYQGFEIFEPHKRYIGVVVGHNMYAAGLMHYTVFWFDSSLTTSIYCDNIELVYDKRLQDS